MVARDPAEMEVHRPATEKPVVDVLLAEDGVLVVLALLLDVTRVVVAPRLHFADCLGERVRKRSLGDRAGPASRGEEKDCAAHCC